MAVVKGEVKWCSIQQPNTTFAPVWCVDVIVTDDEIAKELKSQGLKLKTDKDGDRILKVNRNVTKADGKPNKQPVCVDAANKPFEELVGNGSVCNVQYGTYEWKNRFGAGIGADLKGVQVLEHVEYATPDGGEFEAAEVASESLESEAKADADGGEFDDEPF